jgi:hypothetical protein
MQEIMQQLEMEESSRAQVGMDMHVQAAACNMVAAPKALHTSTI